MIEISRFIINTSVFVTFLPLGLSLFWRKNLTGAMFVYFCFSILVATAQIIAHITKKLHIVNLPVLHVYTVVEFCWITWFYHVAMPTYFTRKLAIGTIIIFALAALLNTLYLQPVTQFNTYARTLASLIVICYALTYFYKLITEVQITNLERDPIFWINTGFLIYFSGGTLLFVFSNFILPFKSSLNIYVWALHAIFSILLYLIQSIGIWVAANNRT